LGLLIADVVDKGAAAALLMAISWDSLNAYACQGSISPHQVLAQANQRMMQRLEGVIFLTAFYAILDPTSGELIYANAGHVRAWDMDRVSLFPGDGVVLYTDGITDAERAGGDFFGEARLSSALHELTGQSAVQIRDGLLARIETFVNGFPRYDDIALLVIHRHEK